MLATLLIKDICIILALVVIVIVKHKQLKEQSTIDHVKVYNLNIIAILHRIGFIP